MGKRVDPKEAAGWIGLALGVFVVLPWLRKLAPGATAPGAEEMNCGSGPFSLTEIQARSIADSIHAAVYDITEDEEAVVRALKQARTDGDVCRIIKAYGKRRNAFFVGPWNLPQVVSMYLNERASWSSDETFIDLINADYARKGISYRF
jgi:hypothetical protein